MDSKKNEKFKISITDVRGDGSLMSAIVKGRSNHMILANTVIAFAKALKRFIPEDIMHGIVNLAYDDKAAEEFSREITLDNTTRGGDANV